MAKKSKAEITIFGRDVTIGNMAVHATMVQDGFIVTMIATELNSEDVIWAGSEAWPVASLDDLAAMVEAVGKKYKKWLKKVAVAHV